MSRGKKAVAQGWNATNKQRDKEREIKNQEKKEIDKEEHEKRIKALKKIGLIK